MGRVLLLIVGFVVALGLGASTQQPGTPNTQPHSAEKQAAASQGATVRAAEPERKRESEGHQDQAKPKSTAVEQADLTAQQAMAIFAGLQVLLTFLGLLYIRWTLMETRRAVAEAANATEAAHAAVEVTREATILQNRAWLDVKVDIRGQPQIKDGKFWLPAWVYAENVGPTPATNVRLSARVVLGPPADPTSIVSSLIKQTQKSSVLSPVIFPAKKSLILGANIEEADPRELIVPRIYVCAVYRVGGDDKDHITELGFDCFWKCPPGGPAGHLCDAPEGPVDIQILGTGGGVAT